MTALAKRSVTRSPSWSTSTVSGPVKRAAPKVEVDASAGDPLHGVVVADAGADRAHARHHRTEVDGNAVRHLDAQFSGPANLAYGLGRADDALRRHAAGVEAVAAHEVLLHERDLAPSPAPPMLATSPAVPLPMATRL